MSDDVLSGYSVSHRELIARFEAVSCDRLYQHVTDVLPAQPSRIADIGVGTGRDAAWLADKGHSVVAVEPVDELREAGMALHKSARIQWLNDRMPELGQLQDLAPFAVVLLTAVWQHLDDSGRQAAMRSLAGLVAGNGLVIMSIRHGPGAANRRVFPANLCETISAAAANGFDVVREQDAESHQEQNRAAGVHWTWLALRRK